MFMFLSLVLSTLVFFIIRAMVSDMNAYKMKCEEVTMPQTYCIIGLAVLITFSIGTVIMYAWNSSGLYDLKVKSEVNLPNRITVAKANDQYLVKASALGQKELIADLANTGQSGKNMENWISTMYEINRYNNDLRDFIFAKEHPVLAFIKAGLYPDYGDLKFMELKEIK